MEKQIKKLNELALDFVDYGIGAKKIQELKKEIDNLRRY